MALQRDLSLRIVLEQPPAGVDFGVQKGRGRDYVIEQKQRSSGGDLAFELTVEARSEGEAGTPDFYGPYVQGKRGERFVYVGIGTFAGQADSCWSRRLKVPLREITGGMIRPNTVLEARIPGTGRDGGPTCATPKSMDGWTPTR